MILDHVSIGVSDLGKGRAFYDAVLATLGYARVYDVDIPGQGLVSHGYGAAPEKPEFWIGVPEYIDARANAAGGAHIAFVARARKDVDAFHAAALKHGGRDNGKPGLRPEYHPTYYGAFAFDPDGNKIEACCHHPE
jgi:catechol 2,3-dioxygenase-like lactoylglutathione lyase family enzyme